MLFDYNKFIINEGYDAIYSSDCLLEVPDDDVSLFTEDMSSQKRFLEVRPLDIDLFIERNELKPITNAIFFASNGSPTSDGLLSNEIFGITKDERANTFAYIDLSEWFMHPLCYKAWVGMDRKVREVIHGTNTFIVNDKGELVVDENGSNGIEFLKKNLDKIKFKSTDSNRRDRRIKFLEENKHMIFIRKMIVIPAYYRDVNTDQGRLGVGDINKLYSSLIMAVRSLRESKDYGLNLSAATKGRVQEILLAIYQWFADEPNLSKKNGVIKRAGLTKTTDYASRLVMSAPDLNVEKMEDMMVTIDTSAVPLASICVNFFPFIVFHVRRFFENEFSGESKYPYKDKNGKLQYVDVDDYMVNFSDEVIKEEIKKFVYGYSKRIVPIKVPNKQGKNVYMRFTGYQIDKNGYDEVLKDIDKAGNYPIVDRDLTWCDVLFIAATEATRDKHIMITRYPIDSFYNQFPSKIIISSTTDTEPMVINGKLYKYYPKIRQEDMNINTSNRFVDSLRMSNLHLGSIGGDYDGDQVIIKGIYSKEANQELEKFINSKLYYISIGSKNVRLPSKEAIQAMYQLTLSLDSDLQKPVF